VETVLLLCHIGVAEVPCGQEGLLNGARGNPSFEIEPASGLVVRTGGPCAAEGLLADDGAGGLVVDVEVSGCVAQDVHRLYNGAAVEGENRAGQGVWRGLVAYVQRLVIFIFRRIWQIVFDATS